MKIKNLKNMQFIKRGKTINKHPTGSKFWTEIIIKDHFYHTIAQITLIRVLEKYIFTDGKKHQWTGWLCPELSSGNAPMNYWMNLAKSQKGRNK